jgi:hypothetical protein
LALARLRHPYNVVSTTPPSMRQLQYADESDQPYPIPAHPAMRAAIGLSWYPIATSMSYMTPGERPRYPAGSGAIWNLRSDALRPAGWTSADAGLPIFPVWYAMMR